MLSVKLYTLLLGMSTQPDKTTVSDEMRMFNLTTAQSHSDEVQETVIYTTASPFSNTTADITAPCTKYITQQKSTPSVQLKIEPLCTESGSALDQLMRFIGYQFDKHECGNLNSTIKYTELLYCSMLNAHTLCLQQLEYEPKNTKIEAIPQMSTVRWIIEELCAMKHLIAKECMFKQLKYVSRCVKAEVDSIFYMEDKQWKYGAIDPCRHLEVKVMCMYEGLQPCNERTASLMAGLISENLKSETCTLSGGQMLQPFAFLGCGSIFMTLIFLLLTWHACVAL